ncbi:aromatic ring-hydroxylating oxygenase subunit alpha [Stackebrandtia nassauensis]|uniref:Rieske (2Fe-2S) domain protein n=1 Tax=Stackebrandtia nassauensis (strain DSM 44728 / CIP 108903 / NRRL B-16338 / NBRC 102104 / LLR-40K-21) TaxID=446470 RepID=D3Q872_STANL|nr:aromatic ring-hydroxylating dioxygenase subunit alpha [Stackebrandtia nassauensis]ADD42446.1 Rieske (2Fe-2S) domain protein [Stackebrandtia nassauensis DSM 44728]
MTAVNHQILRPETYYSREWFDREQAELFGDTWQFAGMADDYGPPGAFQSVQAGRHPLVVLRDGEGVLRAFHNLCRHRGAAVLPQSGVVKRAIVCPYHNWTYGLDGCLLATPQRKELDPAPDRSTLGLHPAGLAQWQGMLFVHPDPAAQPLDEWLADLPQRVAPVDPLELTEPGEPEVHHLKCNWKIFMENALDNYHLGYVHRDNLAEYDHKRQEQHQCGQWHWSFYEPPKKPGHMPPSEVRAGLRPIHIDPRWYGSSFGMIFPNTFVLTGPTFWVSVEVIPTGAETTTVRLRARVAAGQNGALARGLVTEAAARVFRPIRSLAGGMVSAIRTRSSVRAAIRKASQDQRRYTVVEEDVFCCEALQRGIRSPRFSIGPVAPRLERGVLTFQQNVRDYLTG